MTYSWSSLTLLALCIALTIAVVSGRVMKRHASFDAYLRYTWIFFLSFTFAEFVSFPVGLWVLALLSFWALREYFSLIDIRLQDRLGILGAYLSIPFMTYFIQIDWYGMFIISIPVYAFLAIPLFITLAGGEARGTVFSVGAIDFGLFLFVYCLGHIGYLLLYSTWMAAMLILAVMLSDAAAGIVRIRLKPSLVRVLGTYCLSLPFTVLLSWLLSPWTGIPVKHALILGALIPALVIMGRQTIDVIKVDMGIIEEELLPGRGQILDSMKSIFYTAPVVFHYIRYFLK